MCFFSKMLLAAVGRSTAPLEGAGRLCTYQAALGEHRARFTSAAALYQSIWRPSHTDKSAQRYLRATAPPPTGCPASPSIVG